MLNLNQYAIAYPNLASFERESDGSLLKGAGYLAGGGYAVKTGIDSGLPRLLGARLERHSTSKDAAKKIVAGGGYLDTAKGDRKSMRLLEELDSFPTEYHELMRERLKASKGKNFISGYHPNAGVKLPGVETKIHLPDSPLRNVLYRRVQALNYRTQGEIDFDKFKTLEARKVQAGKILPKAAIGAKGKTFFVPVTDKEVATKFLPDVDDPIALMTPNKVKVYGDRMGATLGHLKKHGLQQIKANPGRVATGAAILGAAGAIAVPLIKKGYAEVKAFRRKGKLVKAHRRKIT